MDARQQLSYSLHAARIIQLHPSRLFQFLLNPPIFTQQLFISQIQLVKIRNFFLVIWLEFLGDYCNLYWLVGLVSDWNYLVGDHGSGAWGLFGWSKISHRIRVNFPTLRQLLRQFQEIFVESFLGLLELSDGFSGRHFR